MSAGLRSIAALLLGLAVPVLPGSAKDLRIRHRRPVPMKATAYAQHGKTASGEHTRRGIIAADPKVLPLHTTVSITGAGPYSGRYVVKDTGRKIKGRKIDIFVPSRREAKEFGKQEVVVRVVKPAPPQQDQQ